MRLIRYALLGVGFAGLFGLGDAGAAGGATARSLLMRPGACFERFYEDSHLRAHPRQTVRYFALAHVQQPDRASSPGTFEIGIAVREASQDANLTARGVCRSDGRRARCGVEGDGGQFTVTPVSGGLRVDISRLELEESPGDLARGDNRTILLQRAADDVCPTAG